MYILCTYAPTWFCMVPPTWFCIAPPTWFCMAVNCPPLAVEIAVKICVKKKEGGFPLVYKANNFTGRFPFQCSLLLFTEVFHVFTGLFGSMFHWVVCQHVWFSRVGELIHKVWFSNVHGVGNLFTRQMWTPKCWVMFGCHTLLKHPLTRGEIFTGC